MAEPVDGRAEAPRFAADAQIAGTGDLQAAAGADAKDHGHRGMAAAGDGAQGARDTVPIYSGLDGVGPFGGEFGDVGAGGEGRVTGAADDDAPHLVRRRQRVHHVVQARPGGPGQGVQPVRVVEDHGGDGAVPGDEDRFGHGIGRARLSRRSTRAGARP